MGKDYMVDITQDLATFTQTMQQVSDKTVQQLNWTIVILAVTLSTDKTPHTLRQASVMETSTAFTVFKQRGHLESLICSGRNSSW